jgi:hypothetical protein
MMELVSAMFSPSKFDWSESSITFHVVLSAAILYLIAVALLTYLRDTPVAFLKDSKIGLKLISLHNLVLCFGSLYMFVFCLVEVVRRSSHDGIEWLFCEQSNTRPDGALFFYSYVYMLSKYYELLDTFLQLLSGKIPPNFGLHVYHHSLIMILTWIWIEEAGSLQFIGILFNTAVHVVMYYYYYLRSIGISPRWKSHVTRFQIIQFICSLLAFAVTMYYDVWAGRQCKGMKSVMLSIAFNATLLVGFVSILLESRSTKSSKDREQ